MALIFCCAYASTTSAQYYNDFEDFQSSPDGVILTNQEDFQRPVGEDFKVYTYNSNTLGIAQNPEGDSRFIAGTGPGPSMSNAASANGGVSFGDGGIWEISYDVAAKLTGASSVSGLEAIGLFQLRNREAGANATALFRNWLKWSDDTGGGPLDVGYFGFNENNDIFGFYGDNPGKEWSRLLINHWYRVSQIVNFDTNQVLEFGIKDLHTGRHTFFIPPANIFLQGGAPRLPAATCERRVATPSGPGDCYLLPNSIDMRVFTEYAAAGKNVLAFDNISIRQASTPLARGYLFDNGPDRGDGKSAIGHRIAADDFQLVKDANVGRVSVDVSDGPANENRRWDESIEWWILDDNSGHPGNVIASGQGLNHRVHHMTESSTGNRDYSVDFDFDHSVELQANRTYWLGLHLQSNYDRTSVYWNHTAPFAAESEGGDVVPTNRTHRAKSGGQIVSGVPVFPTDSSAAPGKELAFRFIPKLRCRTIFGNTFCIARWMEVTLYLFMAAALLSVAGVVWRGIRPKFRTSSQ